MPPTFAGIKLRTGENLSYLQVRTTQRRVRAASPSARAQMGGREATRGLAGQLPWHSGTTGLLR